MVKRCQEKGIAVAGVTKMLCGDDIIANTLISSRVEILVDARIENLKKLSKFKIKKMLIRIPMSSQAEDVVMYSDIFLVS